MRGYPQPSHHKQLTWGLLFLVPPKSPKKMKLLDGLQAQSGRFPTCKTMKQMSNTRCKMDEAITAAMIEREVDLSME